MGENKRNGRRRVVLFPMPFQGHINPMLQLANILNTKGFSITIIHTNFNSPPPTTSSNFPNFDFLPISDGLSQSQSESPNLNILDLLLRLNSNCIPSLRGSLSSLLSKKEEIACLVTDAHWYFAQDVADGFGLPRLVLQTLKLSMFLDFTVLMDVTKTGLQFPTQDSDEADSPIVELPPLRKKDLPLVVGDPTVCLPILASIVEATKASSGVIFNSCEELEEQEFVNSFVDEFRVPVFLIGPLHGYFSASSSSLLTQDQTCLQWLDKQEPRSVVYASFGSLATISKDEFLEIAWGLSNTNRPFLWVVRPGSVQDSEWMEALPDGLMEDLNGRGKIVKWAPQQDVLSHPATGVFWTHNGWNSTLESICEGVPMICRPTVWDQIPNARFVCEVWRVGIHLENSKKLESGEIEKAVRVLMVDSEGEEIRRRMERLSEKLRKCVLEGGSSYESLENLISTVLSF